MAQSPPALRDPAAAPEVDRVRLALISLARGFDTGAGRVAGGDGDRIDWLRTTPFIPLHLACLAVFWVGVSRVPLENAGALSLCWTFAIPGFYPRYFAHRAFRTRRSVQFVFACLGASSVQ